MTRHILPRFLIALISLSAPTLFGAAESRPCSDHPVAAGAVRTMEEVRAFVQCAYEFAQEVGFEKARQAFHDDARWRSGSIYVVVTEIAPTAEMARALVFPPDPSTEGSLWGPLVDLFGNDYSRELHRIVNGFNDGWLYYSAVNPATGGEEPKAAYFRSIDWDGTPAAIGAGIYRPDLPASCGPEEVNAMRVAADPSQRKAAGIRPLRRIAGGVNWILRRRPSFVGPALDARLDFCVRFGRGRQPAVQR